MVSDSFYLVSKGSFCYTVFNNACCRRQFLRAGLVLSIPPNVPVYMLWSPWQCIKFIVVLSSCRRESPLPWNMTLHGNADFQQVHVTSSCSHPVLLFYPIRYQVFLPRFFELPTTVHSCISGDLFGYIIPMVRIRGLLNTIAKMDAGIPFQAI